MEYDQCKTNERTVLITKGPATVTLKRAGTYNYISTQLGVERRRLYDIVNILESVGSLEELRVAATMFNSGVGDTFIFQVLIT
ncbi:hypothetical protein L1887_03116 [Cichorium endivia]|nr:hypothetical protein L1887_03116 [Cichorium endivia]